MGGEVEMPDPQPEQRPQKLDYARPHSVADPKRNGPSAIGNFVEFVVDLIGAIAVLGVAFWSLGTALSQDWIPTNPVLRVVAVLFFLIVPAVMTWTAYVAIRHIIIGDRSAPGAMPCVDVGVMPDMDETAVILSQPISADSFRDLMARRGRLEQSVLTFEDGAYMYVRLCRCSDPGMSPDDAMEIGAIVEADCGDIILIVSSKFPDRREQLALSIVALTGGRVVECE